MTQHVQIGANEPPRSRDRALATLLGELKRLDYHFITPTPATHKRVVVRDSKVLARDLRDVLGWSRPFLQDLLPADLTDLMMDAGILSLRAGRLFSKVRVSSLGGDLFFHSAFPTTEEDSVFFGPDTYRFADFLRDQLQDRQPGGLLVDVGAGSGAGGVVAAKLARPDRVIMTDTNSKALELARVNATAAGVAATFVVTSGLDSLAGGIDLIVANPPFIAGNGKAVYRDGGDMHGARLSLDWVLSGADKLSRGGKMIMYTGIAIVDGGRDPFRDALKKQLPEGLQLTYREVDPDIFGGQLKSPAYHDVERIAAVGLTVSRPS
jgi:methylase of polypeptide subunit release factors